MVSLIFNQANDTFTILHTDESNQLAAPQDKAYKLSDGDGLFILVRPTGSKYWQYNYQYGHRQRTASYGVYPKTSINEARVKHQELKYQLSQGYNPSEEKRKRINRTRLFKDVAVEWYKISKRNYRSSHHRDP